MNVIAVRPGMLARVETIGDSLKDMQCFVGGLIEELMPFDDEVAIVCNEEGKMSGCALNRAIYSKSGEIMDIVAGDFFVCYAPEESEDFLSLPDELLSKYMELFQYPERFYMTEDRELRAVKYIPAV